MVFKFYANIVIEERINKRKKIILKFNSGESKMV